MPHATDSAPDDFFGLSPALAGAQTHGATKTPTESGLPRAIEQAEPLALVQWPCALHVLEGRTWPAWASRQVYSREVTEITPLAHAILFRGHLARFQSLIRRLSSAGRPLDPTRTIVRFRSGLEWDFLDCIVQSHRADLMLAWIESRPHTDAAPHVQARLDEALARAMTEYPELGDGMGLRRCILVDDGDFVGRPLSMPLTVARLLQAGARASKAFWLEPVPVSTLGAPGYPGIVCFS